MAAPKQFKTPTRGRLGPLRGLGSRCRLTLHKLHPSITGREFCDIVVADCGCGPSFPRHQVRQNVRSSAVARSRKEGVARVIKDQASDDIWHLSIEDLLAPSREPARAAGAGPFVINLRTSSTTIGSPPKGLLPIDRLHVYQLERTHDGRPQFQLRLGIIESGLEADALLSMVREHYPAAIKETAQDDYKAAIARAARDAGQAKPPS